MSEWVEKPLGEIAHLEIGGTPSRDEPRYWAQAHEDGYPWVSIADLRAGRVEATTERITEAGIRNSPVQLVPAGTLLMSFKLTIGQSAIAGCDLFTNEAIVAVTPKSDDISTPYLHIVLPDLARGAIAETAIKGVTLNKKKLAQIIVRYPKDRGTQGAIVEIHAAIAGQLGETEALIAKQERIRAGLLQDLFTRGVDQNGALRPPREEAPDLYHHTELGWLPKGWEVDRVGSIIGPIDSGWSPTCEADPAPIGAWGVLKTTAVVWSGYDPGENKRLPSSLAPNPSIQAVSGDILITRKGPMDRVGVAVHVGETPPHLMFPDTVFRTRVTSVDRVRPAYFAIALQSERVQKHWWQRKIGLADAQVNLNHGIVRKTPLAIPELDEQQRIEALSLASMTLLRSEQHTYAKLRALRSALMQDLLTGRVSIAPLLQAHAA